MEVVEVVDSVASDSAPANCCKQAIDKLNKGDYGTTLVDIESMIYTDDLFQACIEAGVTPTVYLNPGEDDAVCLTIDLANAFTTPAMDSVCESQATTLMLPDYEKKLKTDTCTLEFADDVCTKTTTFDGGDPADEEEELTADDCCNEFKRAFSSWDLTTVIYDTFVDDYEVAEQGFELLPACGDKSALTLYKYDDMNSECREFTYDSGAMMWSDTMVADASCCSEA